VTYVPSGDQVRATGFAKTMKQAAKAGRGALLEAKLMEAAARKRKAVMEIVEECVANKQKVIVFTGRREDCDDLGALVTDRFGSEATVFTGHGGTPAPVRDGIQQAYMAAPGPAVLVGTGDAWGEGVNLQDTDLLLIAMLPYTPGQIVQWEGRVARHGQKRPVMIQYLVAENTVDEHVAGILLEKLPAVEKVSQDDSVDGLAAQLMGADDEDALLESILSKLGAA
jgi:SNF2 family DNA or RNA helicase